MKRTILIFVCLVTIAATSTCVLAQETSTYYRQRVSLFEHLPYVKGKVIFCGNSITDGGEWQEMFNDTEILNRGISGDVTTGVMLRMGNLLNIQPSKLFLLIGVNDLAKNIPVAQVAANIRSMVIQFHEKSPTTKVYLQSVLPVNPTFIQFRNHVNKTDSILLLNKMIRGICTEETATYIDLFTPFSDKNQHLDSTLTNDGLHLTGKGYARWKSVIFPWVYDLSAKPALLPAPRELVWTAASFPLLETPGISADNPFSAQLNNLKDLLSSYHIRSTETKKAAYTIRLSYKKMGNGYLADEAYEITADTSEIILYAQAEKGIYYALQTLRQLMRDGTNVPGCSIKDQPAFAWRGLMHDVGRNFQSIDQLKMQLEILSRYKMNLFHFHLTEDIAWRLESKLYPQLTAASHMQRNAGEYYTLKELKELVQYCKERFITLIPEIDMPGHSAAFKRAMGVDMQSTEGSAICKNILTELCRELDVPYIHIGGDEVKITNPDFLPEMVATIRQTGKQVVAWDPGGNLPKGTVLQMWNGQTVSKKGYPSVDSRHLYLNHFDPIDGVVSVFNHQICDVPEGDSNRLGAIACVWPDRRVSDEKDILTMNPVFPVLLTIAERSWRGGGWKNYQSDIDQPGTQRYTAFTEFENRLLDHKSTYFSSLPFPYVKQSGIHWKLIGPFNNQGKTDAIFLPEQMQVPDTALLRQSVSVSGGTIFLRHFWSPMIGSHLRDTKENSTYYAFTRLYSDHEQQIGLWIGFYNISRSNNSPTPEAGKWDNRNSRIWLNGKEITPPVWSRAGRINTGMEEPLIDEGYEYRSPTLVWLTKGWNNVLLKVPVASFQSSNWQTPVKWMFSCIPVVQKNGLTYFPDSIYTDPLGK